MRLTDLKPRWTYADGTPASAEVATGVMFDCPVHSGECIAGRLYIPFKGPVSWSCEGDSFENLSLKPSIKVTMTARVHWHGFVTEGDVTILSDSCTPSEERVWPIPS